jgi:hypothetical protein
VKVKTIFQAGACRASYTARIELMDGNGRNRNINVSYRVDCFRLDDSEQRART